MTVDTTAQGWTSTVIDAVIDSSWPAILFFVVALVGIVQVVRGKL